MSHAYRLMATERVNPVYPYACSQATWRESGCSFHMCVCEALNLCDKIPGCTSTCAGLAAAECALVIVDKQLQTHKHGPRPSIKGDEGSQPGVPSRLHPSDVAGKWVFIPCYWDWPQSVTSVPFHCRELGCVNEGLDKGIFICFCKCLCVTPFETPRGLFCVFHCVNGRFCA